MILTVCSLAVALLAMGALPAALAAGTWSVRRPRLALAGWVCAVVVGTVALNVAVLSWLLPVPVWQRGNDSISPATVAAFVVGGLGFAGLVAGLSVVLGRAEEQWRRDRVVRRAVLRALTASERYDGPADVSVRVLDDDSTLVASARCYGRQVLIGSRLASCLTPDQLAAVIAHERAHLAGWHDRMLWLAQVNAASFPWVPGARTFAERVDLLIELAADDRAAQECGRDVLAAALRRMAEIADVPGARLRAQRLSP